MDWSKVKPEAIKSDPMYQMGYAAAKAEPANTRSTSEYSEVKQEPVQAVTDILDKCVSLVGTEMVRCTQAGDKWFMCQRFVHAMRDMQYEFKRDYAAPVSAKREWVDLTDGEIGAVMDLDMRQTLN